MLNDNREGVKAERELLRDVDEEKSEFSMLASNDESFDFCFRPGDLVALQG